MGEENKQPSSQPLTLQEAISRDQELLILLNSIKKQRDRITAALGSVQSIQLHLNDAVNEIEPLANALIQYAENKRRELAEKDIIIADLKKQLNLILAPQPEKTKNEEATT